MRQLVGIVLFATLAACSAHTGPAAPPADAGGSDLGLAPGDVPGDVPANVPGDVPGDAPALPDGASPGCRSDRECSAAGMVCDVVHQRCVECLAATDCTNGRACVAARCVAVTRCTSSRMCPGQVCAPALGYCVDCNADLDCPAGQLCRGNACVAAPRPCHSDRECTDIGMVCNAALGHCVQCGSDVDCPAGQLCAPDATCLPQTCTPAAATCTDATHLRTCDARGAAFADTTCPADAPCAAGRCQVRVCAPGAASCGSATERRVCTADGMAYTTTACATGLACAAGLCAPPDGTLYVVLPYRAPGAAAAHEHQVFDFGTRIRQADVFFLVDNSASMQPIIANLRSNLASVIVPGIQAAIPDARIGVGSFDSMPDGADGDPGHPGDYTLWVRQAMIATGSPAATAALQHAFDTMHTIDTDTTSTFFGGDGPECQTEAAYEVVAGTGSHGHETDTAARLSVHNALDPAGDGWVPALNPATDCGAAAGDTRYGFGCFQTGRVPIVVLASDSPWYDGCTAGSPRSTGGHTCAELVAALNAHGGLFIGVDVGTGVGGFTYANAQAVAMMTHTLDGAGAPVVFGPGMSGIAGAAANIVSAISQVTGSSRQDITTHTAPDATATGLAAGHTTADFIRAVVPARATPEAPTGYDRRDATTFYNVAPTTRVYFNVDFYNDFQPAAAADQLFHATINVVGRGGTTVDTRTVAIVVPAAGH